MVGQYTASREDGATIIEAALVLPALLIVLFAFIELARILVIQGLLVAGAKEGLNQAVKITDIEQDSTSTKYNAAKTAVINTAKVLPLATLLTDGAGSGWASIVAVTLVRPGQGAGTVFDQHPLPACRSLGGAGSIAELMVACPIGVRVFAEVRLQIPFAAPLRLRGEAFGFREVAFTDQDVPEVVR